MLTIKNVTKTFNNFTALEDIQLDFSSGVYGLLAPNGAGKTTLLKMIATLLFPTKGEILYEGTNIQKLDEEYRNILGYLPQEFGYYKDYTPRQYLLYLSALKGIGKTQAAQKAEELLDLVSLGEVKNKKMKKFSGGMIQRVGIAQAMLNEPKILVLDEPTAGLDPKERVHFRNIITSHSKDRIVILSTHIVSDIESIANRVIMIKDKKILLNDSIPNICRILDGKVFETYVNENEFSEFEKRYFVLSQRQEHKKMMIRFIFEGEGEQNFRRGIPTLEDVFLYVYREDHIEG